MGHNGRQSVSIFEHNTDFQIIDRSNFITVYLKPNLVPFWPSQAFYHSFISVLCQPFISESIVILMQICIYSDEKYLYSFKNVTILRCYR